MPLSSVILMAAAIVEPGEYGPASTLLMVIVWALSIWEQMSTQKTTIPKKTTNLVKNLIMKRFSISEQPFDRRQFCRFTRSVQKGLKRYNFFNL